LEKNYKTAAALGTSPLIRTQVGGSCPAGIFFAPLDHLCPLWHLDLITNIYFEQINYAKKMCCAFKYRNVQWWTSFKGF